MKRVVITFFSLCLFFIFPNTAVASSYPNQTGYVNDFASILSPSFANQLDKELQVFEQKTTDQIAVVTIKTIQPDTIENYSIHLAEKWKIGQKGKDNGVIILFAMQDHKMRIEVGRGLEGDLTDIQSKHIQDMYIVPAFKNGHYEQGIQNGVNAVITTVTHGSINPHILSTQTVIPQQSASSYDYLWQYLPFGLVFIFFVFGIAHSPRTKLGGKDTWGVTTFWGESSDSNDGGDNSGGGGSFSGGGSSDSW
ncbi:MAG TPA: TPM domain-containing protein [Candidatus Sulfotelmatobacter sp.]|jgi:uncharacterized protein|nr:TPM domain-containing protein [Candidatus Sulfotelmatobacter sp.]